MSIAARCGAGFPLLPSVPQHAAATPPAGIAISSDLNDDRLPHLAYGANGRSRTSAGGTQAGSWDFSAGDLRRRIIVNLLGRPRACNPERDKSNC